MRDWGWRWSKRTLKNLEDAINAYQSNQTEMHIRVWDYIGLILTRAASSVCVIRWKALMATWTATQSYLETASIFGTKNWKEWRKCREMELKREDRRFFSFTTEELGYKTQNLGWDLMNSFFPFNYIVVNRSTTLPFRLSMCACPFGVSSWCLSAWMEHFILSDWLCCISQRISLC